ncbi:MAG TPA: pirin family protein [Acidimicrobiales bacterium]|nr:pirin family protein [Acidimicrobiales bacterium]
MDELVVSDGRATSVGGLPVRRLLPRRGRRTVGAWCFAYHMGPSASPLAIGPHPHIGLQTVTWLLEGSVLHRDSLGSEQVIHPGQLNLMTAGAGVSHSEEPAGSGSGDALVEGIQLWIAQPSSTRFGPAAFEHHAVLPSMSLAAGAGSAVVMVGSFAGATSPARHDTPLVGCELSLDTSCHLDLVPEWEYALLVLRGSARVDGSVLEPGRMGYMSPGRDSVHVEVAGPVRAILVGGEPFPEDVLMWWNFVARTADEVEAATRSWEDDDGRFGRVDSHLDRIPAPVVPSGLHA